MNIIKDKSTGIFPQAFVNSTSAFDIFNVYENITSVSNKKNIDGICKSVDSIFLNMILSNANNFHFDENFFNSNEIQMLQNMYSHQISIILSNKGFGLTNLLKDQIENKIKKED